MISCRRPEIKKVKLCPVTEKADYDISHPLLKYMCLFVYYSYIAHLFVLCTAFRVAVPRSRK